MGGYSIFHETMADMTWVEIERAAKQGAIVLFPAASLTGFGPAMPCAGTIYEAYVWCKLIKRELERKSVQTLLAPPLYWAINPYSASSGSFDIRPEVIKGLFEDVIRNLEKWGFKNVFFGSWHGANEKTLREVCKDACDNLEIKASLILPVSRVRPSYKLTGEEEHVVITPNSKKTMPASKYLNISAGSNEVSYLTAFYPDLVDIDLVKTLKPTELTGEQFREISQKPDGFEILKKMLPDGYIGDPASYDEKAGKEYIEDSAINVATTIEAYMNGTYKPPEGFKEVFWEGSDN